VLRTASVLFGPGKLVDPARIAKVWVSPRVRARVTASLLFPSERGVGEGKGEAGERRAGLGGEEGKGLEEEMTEELAEWDYGLYEGLLTGEIRRGRQERGLDKGAEWDIWRDGCEGGEYVTSFFLSFFCVFGLLRRVVGAVGSGEGSEWVGVE